MFSLHSPAFGPHAPIPVEHTADGPNLSPPLNWEDAPAGTASFALVVEDPDAPDPAAPQRTWVHWVLYNIPSDVRSLGTGAKGDELPSKARPGMNDWNEAVYGGPDPPIGRHRYFHRLYALDSELALPSRATRQDLLEAMKGHVLAEAELVGTYEKAS